MYLILKTFHLFDLFKYLRRYFIEANYLYSIAIKRIRLGIGKYATKNRMVKAWAEVNAFRRSVCLRSKMSKKWYQKFPPVYPSLSSQALAFRKTKRRKRIDQVTID